MILFTCLTNTIIICQAIYQLFWMPQTAIIYQALINNAMISMYFYFLKISFNGNVQLGFGSEKVYFKSQILVHEYWTILDHSSVPVLFASGYNQHACSKEHKYHIFGQYWYTRNVPVFNNTGTVIPVSGTWSILITKAYATPTIYLS